MPLTLSGRVLDIAHSERLGRVSLGGRDLGDFSPHLPNLFPLVHDTIAIAIERKIHDLSSGGVMVRIRRS